MRRKFTLNLLIVLDLDTFSLTV